MSAWTTTRIQISIGLSLACLAGGCFDSHSLGGDSAVPSSPDAGPPSPFDADVVGPDASPPGPGPVPGPPIPPPVPVPAPVPDPDPTPTTPPGGAPATPRPGTCDFRGGPSGPAGDRCAGGGTRFYRVSSQAFSRDFEGRSAGFDLDGRNSDATDVLGCGVPDFLDFNGAPGIDNVLGSEAEVLESITSSDFDAAHFDALASGGLVTVLELRNFASSESADCVDLYVHDGVLSGPQVLDAEGRPAADQEVTLLANSGRHFGAAHIVDGVLRASGGAFPMGVDISGGKFYIDIQAVELAVVIGASGGPVGGGLIGGELRVADFVRGAECGHVPYPADLVHSVLTDASDLRPQPDGTCASFSVAMHFTQVPVHVR